MGESKGVYALAGAALLSMGGLLGWALLPARSASGIAGPSAIRSVPVVTEPFADPTEVQLTPHVASAVEVASPRSGTLTSYECGEALVSGTPAFAIDGQSVLALYTATPLWRDITVGLEGPDVVALQDELERLGFGGRASGDFDIPTQEAFRQMRRSQSLPYDIGETIALGDLVWIPESRVELEQCHASIGQRVEVGTRLASIRPRLRGLAITQIPEGLIPGARVLRIDEVETAVPADGSEIVAAGDLIGIMETEAYKQWEASSSEVPLVGTYRLERAEVVASVPASAVVSVGTEACVFEAKIKPVSVNVVASRLGRTLVQPVNRDAAPRSVVLDPPPQWHC